MMKETYNYVMKKGHHRANKDGYVYEHILVAEDKLGRELLPGEVVHHVDHNPRNNHPDNLMVFKTNAYHSGFHRGVKCKLLEDGTYITDIVSSQTKICEYCGAAYSRNQIGRFCCQECSYLAQRKVERPSANDLFNDLLSMPVTHIGRKYGVSDQSIRKWCKQYQLPYKAADIKDARIERSERNGNFPSPQRQTV